MFSPVEYSLASAESWTKTLFISLVHRTPVINTDVQPEEALCIHDLIHSVAHILPGMLICIQLLVSIFNIKYYYFKLLDIGTDGLVLDIGRIETLLLDTARNV